MLRKCGIGFGNSWGADPNDSQRANIASRRAVSMRLSATSSQHMAQSAPTRLVVGGFFGGGVGAFAFGSGAGVVGSDAFAARFIAAARARASSMLIGARTAWNAVSVTSSTTVVSAGVIVRAIDIEPPVTPGPVTEDSHFTIEPRRGRAASMRVVESDQRRRSSARNVTTTDVFESATPTVIDPSPRVRPSKATSPYNWRNTDRCGACAPVLPGRDHNDSAVSSTAGTRGTKFTTGELGSESNYSKLGLEIHFMTVIRL